MNDVPQQPPSRQQDDPETDGWAAALSTREPPLRAPGALAEDWSRRRLGWLAIVIAVLFPFYQYAVQRGLALRELRAVERAAAEAMQEAGQAAAANARQAQTQRAARELEARMAAARVVGVIDGNPPVVIVADLPPEGAAEVAERICARAAAWLRRNLGGMPLRVTRHRGDRPGSDAGVVYCPKA